MRRKVTESDYERFKRFRRFMEEIPNSDSIVPKDCGSCGCFQPYWKYRTCLYAKCKYNKPINVFRNKPLNVDVIPNPYWLTQDLYEVASDIFGW